MDSRIRLDEGNGRKVDCWGVINFANRRYVVEVGRFWVLEDELSGCDIGVGLSKLLLHRNQIGRRSAMKGMHQHGIGDGWAVHRPLGKELKELRFVEARVRIRRCHRGRYGGGQERRWRLRVHGRRSSAGDKMRVQGIWTRRSMAPEEAWRRVIMSWGHDGSCNASYRYRDSLRERGKAAEANKTGMMVGHAVNTSSRFLGDNRGVSEEPAIYTIHRLAWASKKSPRGGLKTM